MTLASPARPASGAPASTAGSGAARERALWAVIILLCAGAGAFYGSMSRDGRAWVGAVYGLGCGGAVMLFERGVVLRAVRSRLRALPWLPSILATEAAYGGLAMTGGAVAGLALWASGLLAEPVLDAVVIGPTALLYALLVSGVIITMIRMRDLVGRDAFRSILLGRYHEPVEEERIFVFVDLIGSSAYAQRHGDLRAQAFLGAIFAALADPVRRFGGSIDDYVGDMAMVTWRLAEGADGARCIAFLAAFLDAVARDADAWRDAFGEVPTFRAALHGGTVVTAEVGVDRHKIAYFGDVVNTTGRLEALCRALDAPFLISADLLARLPSLPDAVRATPCGAHALKGREQILSVSRLDFA